MMFFYFIYHFGPVSSKDMQTPPLSDMVQFSWKTRNVLKRMEIDFPIIAISIFWFMVDFVHNFQEILPTKNV